jgi:hypothetical protein
VVTTEKDAVKVAPRWPHAAQQQSCGNAPPAALHALRIALRLDDEPAFAARLRQAVERAAASARDR